MSMEKTHLPNSVTKKMLFWIWHHTVCYYLSENKDWKCLALHLFFKSANFNFVFPTIELTINWQIWAFETWNYICRTVCSFIKICAVFHKLSRQHFTKNCPFVLILFLQIITKKVAPNSKHFLLSPYLGDVVICIHFLK